jgi:hypothetical protein
VERLRDMAPEKPQLLIWGERSSRDLNADIREAADTIEALCEALQGVIPDCVNVDNYNVLDCDVVPIDMTMGQLRKIAAALAKAGAQ